MFRKWSSSILTTGFVLLLAAGCDNPESAEIVAPASVVGGVVSMPGDGNADVEGFEICKYGTSATFTVSTSSSLRSSGPTDITLAEDECRVVATTDESGGRSVTTTVTVTEQVPAGFNLDHVDVTIVDGTGTTGPTSVSGPTVTEDIGGGASTVGVRGVLAEFYNVAIPVGGEGCTPGFWRNHHGAWMGAMPGDLFTSVGFTDAWNPARPERNVDPSTLTLGEAVELRGGDVNALVRHAVAAWLNASHSGVAYDLTAGDVVSLFNDAISGSMGATVDGAKQTLEEFNEQGCPLGAADF